MMTDNIGRPLYGLDHETGYKKRTHPYTGEPVADDFEYQYTAYVWDVPLLYTLTIFAIAAALAFIIFS